MAGGCNRCQGRTIKSVCGRCMKFRTGNSGVIVVRNTLVTIVKADCAVFRMTGNGLHVVWAGCVLAGSNTYCVQDGSTLANNDSSGKENGSFRIKGLAGVVWRITFRPVSRRIVLFGRSMNRERWLSEISECPGPVVLLQSQMFAVQPEDAEAYFVIGIHLHAEIFFHKGREGKLCVGFARYEIA